MALDHNEFIRLSKIADSLRRSDPELAHKLAAPLRRGSFRCVLCYLTLSVFAVVTLTTVAIGDTTAPSTIVKNAVHSGERTAGDSRVRFRNQADRQPAGRHASLMRAPVDYGAETP